MGGKVKYNCPHMGQGCTKRLMNHREVCMHLATQHQQLKVLLSSDHRPGLKAAGVIFYPGQTVQETTKVKQEQAEHEPEDNEEDVDDPTPSPVKPKTPIVAKSKPVAKTNP